MADSGTIRSRLRGLGLSDAAIGAAWPRWWSEDAERSRSARTELAFGVARRLGLDPSSLLDEQDTPRFLWREEARFKHLSGEDERVRAGITSFAHAVAASLISATPEQARQLVGASAASMRGEILESGRAVVDLGAVLELAWQAGIPVAHLRVFPWEQKRMAAMCVSVGDRAAILIGRDARYPAPILFYTAHELGHIVLGHLTPNWAIVDLGEELTLAEADEEEASADAFALELLTGSPRPIVQVDNSQSLSANSLAQSALDQAPRLGIEPGMIVECYGYSTGNWALANAALPAVYGRETEMWRAINQFTLDRLDLSRIPPEAADFVQTVLGLEGM
jgi:hypothetical protein